MAAALSMPAALGAQAVVDDHRWVFGAGTFLTRDSGWDYSLGLELGAAVEHDLGARLRLRAGLTALTAPAATMGAEPTIFPPYPNGLEHAAAASVQIRSSPRGAGLYALAGLEAVAGYAGNQGGGVRGGASAGMGLQWSSAARFALEGQYVAFTQPFGTTHGVLSVRLVHRR